MTGISYGITIITWTGPVGDEFCAYLNGENGICLGIMDDVEKALSGLPFDHVTLHFDLEPCTGKHAKLANVESCIFKGKRLFWAETCIDPLRFVDMPGTDRWQLLCGLVREHFTALVERTAGSARKKDALRKELLRIVDKFWTERTRNGAMIPWPMSAVRKVLLTLQVAYYRAMRWRRSTRRG